ncbi:MAG TPA: alpha-amylase/4-alpha-glucanotransferase domain-containing protein [Candidatus Wunengus sp. YC65]|uniref:alpha-amylase/4-alpha-glucanotransferase domain-containing protein n=1 Tax=Candidatus Wunengus sp. YC65 TaxID=3367701 RepID=UPI004027B7F4
MSKKINLILAIHNHQPIGNFDHVISEACDKAYKPFLDILENYPSLKVSIHFSGCLLEWIEINKPDMIAQIKHLVDRNQIELMGGGFYEPIMVMLPERDRIGQIKRYTEYLQKYFKRKIRGMWVPERVWEQNLAKTFADAGMEYTVLDDSHFKYAGLEDHQLLGYYVTEDQGRTLKIFPASELLRYYIPFEEPAKCIEYFKSCATEGGDVTMVYADDGEKFGVWPKTYDHVYKNGWLERFISTLLENRDWINLVTFSDVIDNYSPKGKVYLPDASYREMLEWALPVEVYFTYEDVYNRLNQIPWGGNVKRFMKGGFWRNFKIKYPESNLLYAKMMHVSDMVDSMDKKKDEYTAAQKELFMGQCNCPYWHGVFGGIYLPHLRFAVTSHLIAAEALAEKGKVKGAHYCISDFDCDIKDEICVSNSQMTVYFKPDRGGHIYELDYKPKRINLINTLMRRKEVYHKKIIDSLHQGDTGQAKSIHDVMPSKQAGLEKMLYYDTYLKEGLIDHFFEPGTTLKDVFKNEYREIGSFVTSSYNYKIDQGKDNVLIKLYRDGVVESGGHQCPVRITKEIKILDNESLMNIVYTIENHSRHICDAQFGVEFNVSMTAGDAFGRYYYIKDREIIGNLSIEQGLNSQNKLGLVDEWLGVEVLLDWNIPGDVFVFPIYTVSQSESGYELVYQNSSIIPRWSLNIKSGEKWRVVINKSVKSLKSTF